MYLVGLLCLLHECGAVCAACWFAAKQHQQIAKDVICVGVAANVKALCVSSLNAPPQSSTNTPSPAPHHSSRYTILVSTVSSGQPQQLAITAQGHSTSCCRCCRCCVSSPTSRRSLTTRATKLVSCMQASNNVGVQGLTHVALHLGSQRRQHRRPRAPHERLSAAGQRLLLLCTVCCSAQLSSIKQRGPTAALGLCSCVHSPYFAGVGLAPGCRSRAPLLFPHRPSTRENERCPEPAAMPGLRRTWLTPLLPRA